ncbi:MAG: helix-turn-helix domain-containing protein [Actinomycetota bacterium]
MRIPSPQGPVLEGVALVESGGSASSSALDVDHGHHHLVWPESTAAQVRGHRFVALVSRPFGLWIPAHTGYAVMSDAPVWVARWQAASCAPLWRRRAESSMHDVLAPLLVSLRNNPTAPWAGAAISAVVDHIDASISRNQLDIRMPVDDRARVVAEALISDPADPRDLSEWARDVGTSERTLRRLFSTETGVPFTAWRSRVRLQCAMRWLQEGMPAGEVARRSGYQSHQGFSRAFRAAVGRAPSELTAPTLTPTTPPDWPPTRTGWPMPLNDPSYASLTHLVGAASQGDGQMIRNSAVTSAVIAAALVLAACGSADDHSESTSTLAARGSEDTSDETTPQTTAADEGDDAMVGLGFPDDWGAEVTEAGLPGIGIFERPLNIVDRDDGSVVVAHQFGETVIPADADRVLADLFNVEELIAIGVEPVGYTTNSADRELPDFVASQTPETVSVVSTDGLDFEAIAALDPDVIVMFVFDADTYDLLSQIAPTVPLEFGVYGYLDERLRIMGDLFGRRAEAEAAIVEYVEQVTPAREQAQAVFGEDSVSNLVFFGPDAFVYSPRIGVDRAQANLDVSWLYDELGLELGPTLVENFSVGSESLEMGQWPVNSELLDQLQAEHLVVFPNGYTAAEGIPDDYRSFTDTPLWDTLPAVEFDNVHLMTGLVSPRGYFSRLATIDGFVDRVTATQE